MIRPTYAQNSTTYCSETLRFVGRGMNMLNDHPSQCFPKEAPNTVKTRRSPKQDFDVHNKCLHYQEPMTYIGCDPRKNCLSWQRITAMTSAQYVK